MARVRGIGRIVAVVAAVVLAAVAAIAIFVYVQGIEERAFGEAELVDAYVAAGDIEAGIDAPDITEQGLIEIRQVPRTTLPEGYITSLQEISDLRTNARILQGEVLSGERFDDPVRAIGRLDIPEGFEAISVQVATPPGVGGFVRPDDRVSLIVTIEDEDEVMRSQYLLQDILVLAIGRDTTSDVIPDPGEVDSVLFTLAVEPEDAERLVFGTEQGSLWFTLLPEGAEPGSTPGRTRQNLFN